MARFFKNSFICEGKTLKKIILKGQEFRGGSDEKMWRMWLGREIVVAGLPPLPVHLINKVTLKKVSKFFADIEMCLSKN